MARSVCPHFGSESARRRMVLKRFNTSWFVLVLAFFFLLCYESQTQHYTLVWAAVDEMVFLCCRPLDALESRLHCTCTSSPLARLPLLVLVPGPLPSPTPPTAMPVPTQCAARAGRARPATCPHARGRQPAGSAGVGGCPPRRC